MTEIMWAIKSPTFGLYYGTFRTRIEVIAKHVSKGNAALSPYPVRGKLDENQREAWAKHRKHGDRCVRVEVRELVE